MVRLFGVLSLGLALAGCQSDAEKAVGRQPYWELHYMAWVENPPEETDAISQRSAYYPSYADCMKARDNVLASLSHGARINVACVPGTNMNHRTFASVQ